MIIKPVVHCSEKFKILYDLPKDASIVIAIGGRGGMKTYEISKNIVYNACIKNKRVQVLRDQKSHVKESILNEILLRYDTANENGALERRFTKLETGIKNNSTNEMVVFTKGFQASSNDKRANLKSVSNIDIAVIEEAEDIRDEDKFNTFADSVRKEGSYIIIVLNTPDINHWIVKRFFNLVPTDYEGYYKLEAKAIKGFVCIQTSYLDNPFLAQKTIESYGNYGNPESNQYNLHYYLTAILGYASTGLKGQIFKKYTIISKQEFDEVEAQSVIGLDFGTSSPAGMVEVKIIKNRIYIDELNYVGLATKELAIKMNNLGITSEQLIIADSAEPNTISALRNGIADKLDERELELYPTAAIGFKNIWSAKKGKDSIKSGINDLLSMEMYVTERSTNLIMEFSTYTWAMDRNGNSLDVPIDANNHLIDPTRYVKSAKGIYFE